MKNANVDVIIIVLLKNVAYIIQNTAYLKEYLILLKDSMPIMEDLRVIRDIRHKLNILYSYYYIIIGEFESLYNNIISKSKKIRKIYCVYLILIIISLY
jgi:hypothetical protein